MLDSIAIASVAVLFTLAIAYVHACESLQPVPPKGDRS